MRVNLSDLAAKGAEPFGYLLACHWSAALRLARAEAFCRRAGAGSEGVRHGPAGWRHGRSTPGPASFSMTLLGWAKGGHGGAGDGARPGDLVFVTGQSATAGWGWRRRKGQADAGARADRGALSTTTGRPCPRRVRRHRARHGHGLVDVSDGLIADLAMSPRPRRVGIEIDLERPRFRRRAGLAGWTRVDEQAALEQLATGGDDYEIAFTAAAASRGRPAARGRAPPSAPDEGSVRCRRGRRRRPVRAAGRSMVPASRLYPRLTTKLNQGVAVRVVSCAAETSSPPEPPSPWPVIAVGSEALASDRKKPEEAPERPDISMPGVGLPVIVGGRIAQLCLRHPEAASGRVGHGRIMRPRRPSCATPWCAPDIGRPSPWRTTGRSSSTRSTPPCQPSPDRVAPPRSLRGDAVSRRLTAPRSSAQAPRPTSARAPQPSASPNVRKTLHQEHGCVVTTHLARLRRNSPSDATCGPVRTGETGRRIEANNARRAKEPGA
jgi:thiamine monophosphate kinase